MTSLTNISVFFPSINNTYDFSVPSNMSIKIVCSLIMKIMMEEYSGILNSSTLKHSLLVKKTGEMLNESLSLMQLGIRNGEHLIFV